MSKHGMQAPCAKQQAHRLTEPADVLSFPMLAPLALPLAPLDLLLNADPEVLAPLEEADRSDKVLPVVRLASDRPTDTTWSGDVLYGLLSLSGDDCSKQTLVDATIAAISLLATMEDNPVGLLGYDIAKFLQTAVFQCEWRLAQCSLSTTSPSLA